MVHLKLTAAQILHGKPWSTVTGSDATLPLRRA